MLIDYSNCIVNLACSILKHFGAEYEHSTLKEVDDLLKKDYKNVVVLLLDGIGVDALEYHLPKDSFFRRNLMKKYSSVFPPTTTAATTTMQSGLTPLEHGWLGWSLYFHEVDKIVDAFINMEKDTEIPAAKYHVAGRYIPYKTIYEKIQATGKAGAYSVSHFGTNRIETFNELLEEITRLCSTSERKYIYGYWEYPDSLMHQYGCDSKLVTENIKEIEEKVENMCKQLSDTLVIITADHGHGNLQYYVLSDYPNIACMLKRPISLEPRATVFYVKDEFLEAFPVEFQKAFGDDFLLYSHNEVIDKNLFGTGKMHPRFKEFIGDFLAIALKDKGIVYSHESTQFLSHHAGLTEKEMIIPLIAVV